MNLTKSKIILTTIIILAIFLRFWQLGINPPSLTWDEAAWGYNAYSLGIDGRDEFGKFLPLNYLESFGDFKPPMYAYLDIIPIKIFGLNELAVRFPSAFFGVLTVLITYLLTKRIFQVRELLRIEKRISANTIALLASLFLAISPWHIMLSRAAFEANTATFFLAGGVWLFLRGIQGKKWSIIYSIAFFVLSTYTFNTARIVTPILVLILGIGFKKELWVVKKYTTTAIILGILLILPILGFLFSSQANLRFREVNIFSNAKVIETANQEMANDKNKWWSKVIHNRRFAYSVEYLRHYFDNLNPSFLFIRGDGNPKFSTQDVGELYLWDLPFILIGAFLLFRKREGKWWIIPAWLLIGIIPAATARETPHALRIETTLPTFQILVAYGFSQFLLYIKKNAKFFKAALIFIGLTLLANSFYFFRNYTVHYSYEFSGEWQYGYKDSIKYVKSVEKKFKNIYITSDLGRPYIYYLFYTKTDPRIFRKDSDIRRDAFGFVTVDRFGKYNFLNGITKVDDRENNKNLFIKTLGSIPSKANVLKKFYLLNNNVSLVAYE